MRRMTRQEFRHIRRNRLLLLSVIVICFIPFLYSIFFLKSVWDPYGSTENLPVAVVNKDIPVEYQGRKMAVGRQTVRNLKNNDSLKWEFVSAKKARYGLRHREYYTVVTIPKDFSQNAATVMDKHPKTMKLKYETNGSLNYIGEVISQLGMSKLNTKIRASVTNAYASAMFKELYVVGKGMGKAASGAQQLDNGIVTLNNGVNQYLAGVSQVNNGVQEMRVKVAPLTAGAAQLASGSQTLANGIRQYTGGVGLLGAGVSQLIANSNALDSGADQLQSGVGQFATGVNQLNSGLGTLDSKGSELQAGANSLAAGAGTLASGLNAYGHGAGQVSQGAAEFSAQVNGMIPDLQNRMTAMSGNVKQNAAALQSALTPLAGTASSLNQLAGQLSNVSSQLGKLQQAASQTNNSQATAANSNSSNINNAKADLSGIDTSKLSDADKAKVQNALNELNSASTNQPAAGTDNKANTQLAGQIGAVKSAVDQLQGAVAKSATTAGQNSQQVLSAAQGLENSLNEMQNNSSQAIGGISSQLTAATSQLAGATGQLASNATRLSQGAAQLQAGAQTAQAGVSQYTAGVHTAAAGSARLAANTGQLQAGAGQLANGVRQYTNGVSQVGSGISQLNANSGQLNSGALQLSSALGQLNAQIPTLVAGVNQLAAGTQQLADNSPALTAGIARLNAGSAKLATSLGRGAKTINGIKPTRQTAKMFAEPTTLKHTNYSYVPNYGHALAPYVLSVALYVGALIFNFIYPIRRVAEQGKAPVAWWASKVVVGSCVVIGMAVVEGGIMALCGLNILHLPSYFMTLISFGLASMAVIMFLSMTFDNPGRFVAMVLLMLQLGGSGGTFPMEVTMKFYNVIHWYLPMTYSILGLRDSISGGLGQHYVLFCNAVLLGIAVVFFLLLLGGMTWLQHHHFAGKSELDNNQELLGDEKDDDGMHLQERKPLD